MRALRLESEGEVGEGDAPQLPGTQLVKPELEGSFDANTAIVFETFDS